ncbi:MAG: ATP-binding protein [Pirellulaceae bacterium]
MHSNGTLEGNFASMFVRPQLLLLDELGYLPIDKRGADLMFQVVAARYEADMIVGYPRIESSRMGPHLRVDNTLATAASRPADAGDRHSREISDRRS